jgi:hypothetical protein
MLMLDSRRDYIQSHLQLLDDEGLLGLTRAFASLQATAEAQFSDDGVSREKLRFEWHINARYTGQEHTVKVVLDELQLPSILERFHAQHEQAYTFRLELPIEVVNLHHLHGSASGTGFCLLRVNGGGGRCDTSGIGSSVARSLDRRATRFRVLNFIERAPRHYQ